MLREVLGQLQRAASSKLPIVLLGETGTGKEGCSRAVHGWSRRRGSFVAVNCAALPSTLAEAELFGYQKGAFTGADLCARLEGLTVSLPPLQCRVESAWHR